MYFINITEPYVLLHYQHHISQQLWYNMLHLLQSTKLFQYYEKLGASSHTIHSRGSFTNYVDKKGAIFLTNFFLTNIFLEDFHEFLMNFLKIFLDKIFDEFFYKFFRKIFIDLSSFNHCKLQDWSTFNLVPIHNCKRIFSTRSTGAQWRQVGGQ